MRWTTSDTRPAADRPPARLRWQDAAAAALVLVGWLACVQLLVGQGWVPGLHAVDRAGALATERLAGAATALAVLTVRWHPVPALTAVALLYPPVYYHLHGPGLANILHLLPVLVLAYGAAASGRLRAGWVGAIAGLAAAGLVAGHLVGDPGYRQWLAGLLVRPSSEAGGPAAASDGTVLNQLVGLLNVSTAIESLALVGAAVLLGRAAWRQTCHLDELRRRHEELTVLRAQERARLIADERTRIARDLHDIVAHHVSAIVVRAHAAERVAAARPDEAVEAVGWIAAAGAEALAAMRQVVRVLRATSPADPDLTPGATRAALTDAVERVRALGLDVDLHLPDGGPPMSPTVETAAVRIAQEGLTNVVVHAQAARAIVTIAHDARGTTVSVEDDGRGLPSLTDTTTDGPVPFTRRPPGARGHGLIGMNERAVACGGVLLLDRGRLGGLRVMARLSDGPDDDGRPSEGARHDDER